MRHTILAAVLLPALPLVVLSAPAPASAGGPTCRGLAATHIGTPGETLRTTPGPDVVVTNGARQVYTLNGDDIICATRTRFVLIVPGGGDDLVDATGFPGDNLETALGNVGVEGSSGDDTYLGGDQLDQVFVWSGVRADHKDIHLDGGSDQLTVDRRYPGRITAKLGVGSDDYWNDRPRAGVRVYGGEGRDAVITECIGCDDAELRLGQGTILINGAPAGRARGFEDAQVINFGSRVVPRALVVGTADANLISVTACRGEARGLAGDDVLSAGTIEENACDVDRGVALGGSGDDSMTGAIGDDVLRGGTGNDGADGRRGQDLCRAETKSRCER